MTQKPVLILLRNSKVENLQQLCSELGFISVSNCKRVQKWIYSYWSEKPWLKKCSHNTGWIFDQLKNNWLFNICALFTWKFEWLSVWILVIHNRSVMVFIFFPLIHCFHLDCPVPFAIIFGGTDLNEHKKDKEKFEAMSKVVVKARYIFTFTASLNSLLTL